MAVYEAPALDRLHRLITLAVAAQGQVGYMALAIVIAHAAAGQDERRVVNPEYLAVKVAALPT